MPMSYSWRGYIELKILKQMRYSWGVLFKAKLRTFKNQNMVFVKIIGLHNITTLKYGGWFETTIL